MLHSFVGCVGWRCLPPVGIQVRIWGIIHGSGFGAQGLFNWNGGY